MKKNERSMNKNERGVKREGSVKNCPKKPKKIDQVISDKGSSTYVSKTYKTIQLRI